MAGKGKVPIAPAELLKIAEVLEDKAGKLRKVAAAIKKKKLPYTEAMGKSLVDGKERYTAYSRIDSLIRSCKSGIGEV